MSLYSVTKEKLALDAALDEAVGEVADADIDRVLGLIDRNEQNLAKAVETVAEYNFELLAEVAAQKARRDAHAERARILEGQAKRLKEWCKKCFEAMGLRKVKGGVFTASIKGNGGKLPLRVWSTYTQAWEKPEDVPVYGDAPEWAYKIEKKWDTEAIREHLAAQTPSPEQEVDTIAWATLERAGDHLEFGPKPKADVQEASEEGVA